MLAICFIQCINLSSVMGNKFQYTSTSCSSEGRVGCPVTRRSLIPWIAWLHFKVSLSKILNPKLLLISWLAPCMAASAISVWMCVNGRLWQVLQSMLNGQSTRKSAIEVHFIYHLLNASTYLLPHCHIECTILCAVVTVCTWQWHKSS